MGGGGGVLHHCCTTKPSIPLWCQVLHISENNIGIEGINAFSAGAWSSLETLNVAHNNFGVQGSCTFFYALASGLSPNLTELYFSGNCMGPQGTKALSVAISKGMMRKLMVRSPTTAVFALAVPNPPPPSDLFRVL